MKLLISGIFAATGLAFAFGAPTEAAPKSRRAGTVLYSVKENASAEALRELDRLLSARGYKHDRELVAGKVHQARAKNAGTATEEELSAEFIATGAVAFAEPDYRIKVMLASNDPSYGLQWHHPKIGSAAAWDVTVGSSAVVTAVCDTGVQSDHPDLAANLILPGYNSVDGTTNSSPIHSHGTMVAGYMAAAGGNGIGVAGVAWNVKIIPVRITNSADTSAYLSDMSDCIRYAADRGAKVVNLSYGGANSSTIDTAARYLRDRGGLLFMAAGNSGLNISASYPDFTSFVLVGATTSADARANFSNYGTAIDVVAPGVSVYSTTTGSSYTSGSGTSFASPIAAGVGALLFSVNPGFTPAEVEQFLYTTAADLGTAGEDSVYGHGRVDAAAAVAKAAGFTQPEPTPTPTPTPSPSPSPTPTPSPSPSPTPTPTPTPSAVVSVSRIDMSLINGFYGDVRAKARVYVVNGSGQPVSGATVSGSWSGVVFGSSMSVTGSDGSVSLPSPKTYSYGTFTFRVTGVSAAGLSYDPTRNLETSDSIRR